MSGHAHRYTNQYQIAVHYWFIQDIRRWIQNYLWQVGIETDTTDVITKYQSTKNLGKVFWSCFHFFVVHHSLKSFKLRKHKYLFNFCRVNSYYTMHITTSWTLQLVSFNWLIKLLVTSWLITYASTGNALNDKLGIEEKKLKTTRPMYRKVSKPKMFCRKLKGLISRKEKVCENIGAIIL